MAQRDNENLIAPNQGACKHICHLWSRLPRIGALVSHRFTIYVVPHLDPNFRKSRRHISSSGLFWKGTFSSSCRRNPYSTGAGIVPSAALLVEENAFCLLLSKLLKYNCTLNQHFPSSSNVKQETQPPNLNTRQVAWKMKINFQIQKPCASVIENLFLSEWESLSSLLVICFCFSFLVEKFSRVFFKLSSLAKRWLKLKRELGVGLEAALGLFLWGGRLLTQRK